MSLTGGLPRITLAFILLSSRLKSPNLVTSYFTLHSLLWDFSGFYQRRADFFANQAAPRPEGFQGTLICIDPAVSP
jgi:hypothetical protein